MTTPHRERDVAIGSLGLPGRLTLPQSASALVVFAHGSGSSRLSPRNRAVAEHLNNKGLATLLFDLLTEEEAADRHNVFDIPLLGRRVLDAVTWAKAQDDIATLPVGIFGASTGAGAALVAAAEAPDLVGAVVSRGGRPDLADGALPLVRSPTLLIVGGRDREVLELNRIAEARMGCETSLVVIPGATHLFEEPGTLELAMAAASSWFVRYLSGNAATTA